MKNGLPSDYYIRRMNECLSEFDNPKVLIHSCCAPCSSFCLLTLRNVASLSVYYYNPNITASDEYEYRLSEIKRLVDIYNNNPDRELPEDCRQIYLSSNVFESGSFSEKTATAKNDNKSSVNITSNYVNSNFIDIVDAPYNPDLFFEKTKGMEQCPERGERCGVCFDLRLRQSAVCAKEKGYDFFATTLTLSPLKDADLINEIGERIAAEIGIKYLPTDFKKKNGYKMSIELSKEFDLYRQNYCGCVFSKRA